MADLVSLSDMMDLADLIAGFHFEIDADLGDGTGAATTLAVRSRALGYAFFGDGSSIYGTGVTDLMARVIRSCEALATATTTSGAMRAWFSSLVSDLDGHCRTKGASVSVGITTLDSFLNYYNDLVYAQAVISWRLALIYYACRSALLTADNVWPPVTTLGDYNIGTSTFTDGDAIPRDNVGTVQGYAAPLAECAVTTQISGGDAIITVTGTDRTGATGKTWTATIPNGSIVGTKVDLTAGTAADDRIADISGIGVGTASGGAFDVLSKEERTIA